MTSRPAAESGRAVASSALRGGWLQVESADASVPGPRRRELQPQRLGSELFLDDPVSLGLAVHGPRILRIDLLAP